MKTDDLDKAMKENLSGAAPGEIHKNTQHHFEAFAARLREMPAKRTIRERHPLWWLWSGLGLAGTAVAAVMLVTFFFSPSVSWAEVVEKFRALRFFNATVYFSPDSAHSPDKLEIWATQDRRTRVHYRDLIFFSDKDKLTMALNAQTGEEIPAADLQSGKYRQDYPAIDMALGIHQALGHMPNFSLDELLAVFSNKSQDLKPVPNMDASIAGDMQVFDIAAPQSAGWIRLWVLKKSGLVTRLRSLEPESGAQTEAVFDYFTTMPDEAFDPAKVQAAIRKQQGNKSKLYALLKDPGGRPLTPADMFNQTGYHLPNLLGSGRTEDGVFWVLSNDAINRRADGVTHRGWGRLTDNLGQKYLCVWAAETAAEGKDGKVLELEYYIPLNYRTGCKKPDTYTLTCLDREEYSGVAQPVTIIGSRDLAEHDLWNDNQPIPKLYGNDAIPGPDDFLEHLLPEICSLEEWNLFDQLAATIPGKAEENTMALFRDIMTVRKLDRLEKHDEAVALRARLFPLVSDAAAWSTGYGSEIVNGYISDLIRAGQRDTARKLANQYAADVTKIDRQSDIEQLVAMLHRDGMSQDDVREFFDQDVLNFPAVKSMVSATRLFQMDEWNPATSPKFAEWRDYVARLAGRYSDKAPSGDFELIYDQPDINDMNMVDLPLPGHPEYHVTCIPCTKAGELAGNAARTYGIDPSLVTLTDPSAVTVKPAVCVYRKTADWKPIWAAYLKHNDVDVVEKSAARKVLVAHYDGRKLPNCFQLPRLDAPLSGGEPFVHQGGTSMRAGSVLEAFARALNHGLPEDDAHRTIIINETGISEKRGPNQSDANVCLDYDFSFWTGEEANKLAFKWFEDNFGITFHEEERAMKALELRPAKQQ